ncbi:unnamed protein product, partial [marine sediment metagenome]
SPSSEGRTVVTLAAWQNPAGPYGIPAERA